MLLRPPPFPAPSSLAEWRSRRRATRRTLWRLLGVLPPRPSPVRAVRVGRRTEADYVREELLLDNGTGIRVPASLILPRHVRPPHPAILYHHSHFGDYGVGRTELFEPWPVADTPAVALARGGWAVLAVDAWAFGDRQGQGPGGPGERGREEEASLAKLFLWQGTSLWAMMVRDDLIALDYLSARPEVDARRLGATGMSMGSTRTWWLAALDDRVAAAVCVGCLTHYQSLLRHRALARHGFYYFLPGVLRHFDTEAIVSLIAPRPLLALTGARDPGSPADGVRTIARFCAGVYALHGRRGAFTSRLYPGVGHDYTPAMWRGALDWFARHLRPAVRSGARTRRARGQR